MPSKFVFPGGALEPSDAEIALGGDLGPDCARRLALETGRDLGRALALSAVRETFEETGLALGAPHREATAAAPQAPTGWRAFLGRGLAPALDRLSFVFRAITPPTRPLRFDARFFLADVSAVVGDPDDFSGAEAELSRLGWLTLAEARSLDLPFITTVVLGEVEARLDRPEGDRPVPFFRHDGGRSVIEALP